MNVVFLIDSEVSVYHVTGIIFGVFTSLPIYLSAYLCLCHTIHSPNTSVRVEL